MKNFLQNLIFGLNKIIKSSWFSLILLFIAFVVLIWLIIPNISFFGLSILTSQTSKWFTMAIMLALLVLFFLQRKGWLSPSRMVLWMMKSKKKKRHKRIESKKKISVLVKQGTKEFVALLARFNHIKKQSTPIYIVTGYEYDDIDAVLRHCITKDSASPQMISKQAKKYADCITWKASDNMALLGIYHSDSAAHIAEAYNVLMSHDKRYPLNGIIYSINLSAILKNREDESYQKKIEADIFALRDKLEWVESKYGIKIPVYVLLSGIEGIKGFSDYFSVCSERVKQSPLGVTCSTSAKPTYDYFKTLMSQYFEMLNQNILVKCDSSFSQEKTLNIINFSKQVLLCVDELEPILCRFMDINFQKGCQFRGLYFFSYRTSENVYDFMSGSNNSANTVTQEQRLYFLQGLFPQVVLPEAYHFAENIGYMKKRKRNDHIKSISIVSAGIILAGLWVKTSLSHMQYFNNISNQYNQLLLNKDNESVMQVLYRLSLMIDQSERMHSNGLYYENQVSAELATIYQNMALKSFLPTLRDSVAKALSHALDQAKLTTEKDSGSKQSIDDIQSLHQWLATYLMFTQPKHMDQKSFRAQIESIWAQENLASEALVQSEKILDALLQVGLPTQQTLDATLILQSRQLLRANATYMLAYQAMKVDAVEQSGDYVLLGDASFDALQIFENKRVVVPKFFTRDGYIKIYLTSQMSYLNDAIQNMWVLGDSVTSQDRTALVASLKQGMYALYWNDYLDTWNKAINEIQLLDVNDISKLVEIYNNLSVDENPMTKLIHKISINTNFNAVRDIVKSYGISLDKNIVTAQYQGLIALDKELRSDSSSSSLSNIATQVSKLRNDLTSLSLSSQPVMQAYKAVEDGKGSALFKSMTELWAGSDLLPQPLQRWLRELINDTTRILYGMAGVEITNQWKLGPYDYYQKYLINKYPLNPTSDKYVNPKAFIDFFKKGGVVDQYIDSNIKVLTQVNPSNGKLEWAEYYGVSFSENNALLSVIDQARLIQSAFFSNDDGDGFKVTFTPDYLDDSLSMLTISYGNQHFTYANGPQVPFDLNWPAKTKEIATVVVSYRSKDGGTNSFTYDGDWALFKFIQNNKLIYNDKKSAYQLYIYDNKGKQLGVYILNTSSLDNPFNMDMFTQLQLVDNINAN